MCERSLLSTVFDRPTSRGWVAADAGAMHLLARSQCVVTLGADVNDAKFVDREVQLVSVEIIDITPAKLDDRLAFLR